jgi:EAL domain-containing protein (putative c-di-GMP-specific phosphodiesterase class I)
MRAWLDQGLSVPVAVNLSPRCLLDTRLPRHIRDLIEQNDVPAHLLRLEVTEGAIMADTTLAVAILTELHELGVRLSIDDYGTGYSSMSYLKQLPVDELKIDRSFVMDMTLDDNNAMLVRGAIELGHSLGLSVVAEGVELAGHVDALRDLGCDVAQGYHYAHPMPSEQLTVWLQQHLAATAGDPTAPSGSRETTPTIR